MRLLALPWTGFANVIRTIIIVEFQNGNKMFNSIQMLWNKMRWIKREKNGFAIKKLAIKVIKIHEWKHHINYVFYLTA